MFLKDELHLKISSFLKVMPWPKTKIMKSVCEKCKKLKYCGAGNHTA